MSFDISRYEHIIWDWNGTIVDDVALCVESLNRILSSRRMRTTTTEEYRRQFGFPVIDYYAKLGFDFEASPYELVADEFIRDYESRRHLCSLYPQSLAAMKKFRSMGLGQSVLSASKRTLLLDALDSFGLRDYFAHITGLDDYYAVGKADAGCALLKRIGLAGERVLLIGDTVHDYEVSCYMGVDCLLISCGHQSKQRLVSSGGRVCDDLSEIICC